MENETITNQNAATFTEPQGGPGKFCTSCGAQLHTMAEICPKCGVRQTPINAPQQGAAAGAEPQQAAAVKYCPTCGAQLHMLAEICPKCGVRQAPQRQVGASRAENLQAARNMDFGDRIKNLLTSNGRAGRKEFIIVGIICKILAFILVQIAGSIAAASGEFDEETVGIIAICAAGIPSLIYLICAARRLHDMNLSGWFVLIIVILSWGALATGSDMLVIVAELGIFILLASIPGTVGSNKYGEPPQ